MILNIIMQNKKRIATFAAMLSLLGCAAAQPQYTIDPVTGQQVPVYNNGGGMGRTVAATAAGVALGSWAYNEWDDDDDDHDDYHDQQDENWDQASENYRNAQQNRQQNYRNSQQNRQTNRQERFNQRNNNQGNRQMMRQERRGSTQPRVSAPRPSAGARRR